MKKNPLGAIFPTFNFTKSTSSLFVFSTFLFIGSLFAQTTIIDPATVGGFESGATFALNGWTATTGSTTPLNHWVCNTAATSGFLGTKCAYISRNGTIHEYNKTETRASHLYRNITIPAGESDITLSFNWMGQGESAYDRMSIWIVPTSFTPTYGTEISSSGTAPTGNIQVGATNYSGQATWTATSFKLPASYAGTTVKLVFEWRNDGSLGTQPPAAIDNISLTSAVASGYCTYQTTSSSYWISNFTTTGGIANINKTSTYTTGGYANYSATDIVSKVAGSSFNFNTTTGGGGTHGINIWVDWNNDLDFADAGEKVYASDAYVSSANGTITVPVGTLAGNYRMRIVAHWFNTDPASCGSETYTEAEDYTVQVIAPAACSGTPTAGIATASPASSNPGSTYIVSATGFINATGLTFQWQNSTNGGAWTNQGIATGTYSNFTAIAPALGTTVHWHLIVTCTSNSLSSTSTNGTFISVSTLNIPTTGNNSVTCGTNIALYDNGGASGDYANSSNGYTVLNAGLGATINISGSYETENSYDNIRIYNGTDTTGTLLATFTGIGNINYTGTSGQTLTIQFTSDGSGQRKGFELSVSYTGVCYPACSGTPTGGFVSTSPNTNWPGSAYVVSATGYTQALNMTYQWQYSVNGGTNWINAGTTTTSYLDFNASAPASGTVLWQLIVKCTNSNLNNTSSTGTFTTMFVSGVLTGCPNVVSGGLNLNGANPPAVSCTASSTCVDLEAKYLDLGNTTSYIVEPIAYNPPHSFTGLANPVSVNIDDRWSPVVNLPFDFCFYGNTYNKCLVSSNGVITFDLVNNSPGNFSNYSFSNNLPNTNLFLNSIFGVYHDINPAKGGQIGWELITLPTGCRALVASWNNVPMFSENAILYTGMMVLYENSNIIEVYIKNKQIDNYNISPFNGGNAVVGIQNANGTLASVPPGRNSLDTNWNTTNEAWRFVPNGTSIASLKWYEGSGITGPTLANTDTITVCPTTTTTYTAEITYTLCDGKVITQLDETTVTINSSKLWTGASDTNWNIANNWNPVGVPTDLDCVVIPNVTNKPVVSGTNYNGLGLNLTINNNTNLTVTSNNAVTITDWIKLNPTGELKLQSSASLIQKNNVANLGAGKMKMDRTASMRKLDYVYWSSPVTFGSSFSSGAISPGSPTNLIFKWTPTIGTNTNGFGNWTQAVENMAIGKGYIVRGPNSYTGTAAPFTATFIGTPNNGNITAPIQRGTWNSGNYSTGVSTTLGTNVDDNWNLIGNPYPSAINAIDFLTLNTNLAGFVMVWTHGTLPSAATIDPFYNDYVYNYTVADYITYNKTGTSSGAGTYNGFIPAGQGFFVSMLHTTASHNETVQFNNSMRKSSYNNGQFFKNALENSDNEEGKIWLDLVDANGSNVRTLVGYVEGATNDSDRLYDAFTDNKSNLNLYSTIADEPMIIQGRTVPFEQNDLVPMGIKIPQNGNYSITIAALEGLFSNTTQNIYLEDTQTNIIHNLRQNPYVFSAVSGNHPNRFVLRYTDGTLSQTDFTNNTVKVYTNESINVIATNQTIQSVKVYDVLGRILGNYPHVNASSFMSSHITKTQSTLIVEVTLQNGISKSYKVIF